MAETDELGLHLFSAGDVYPASTYQETFEQIDESVGRRLRDFEENGILSGCELSISGGTAVAVAEGVIWWHGQRQTITAVELDDGDGLTLGTPGTYFVYYDGATPWYVTSGTASDADYDVLVGTAVVAGGAVTEVTDHWQRYTQSDIHAIAASVVGVSAPDAGDLLYGAAAGWDRLAAGSAPHVLGLDGTGLPEWQDHSPFKNPVFVASAQANAVECGYYTSLDAALTAASAVAGTAVQPIVQVIGNWTVESTVVVPEYVWLQGLGWDRSTIAADMASPVVQLLNHSRLQNISVSNTKTGSNSSQAVQLGPDAGAGETLIEDIEVRNCRLSSRRYLLELPGAPSAGDWWHFDDIVIADCTLAVTAGQVLSMARNHASLEAERPNGSLEISNCTITCTHDAGDPNLYDCVVYCQGCPHDSLVLRNLSVTIDQRECDESYWWPMLYAWIKPSDIAGTYVAGTGIYYNAEVTNCHVMVRRGPNDENENPAVWDVSNGRNIPDPGDYRDIRTSHQVFEGNSFTAERDGAITQADCNFDDGYYMPLTHFGANKFQVYIISYPGEDPNCVYTSNKVPSAEEADTAADSALWDGYAHEFADVAAGDIPVWWGVGGDDYFINLPLVHGLLASYHSDTVAHAVEPGDLVIGSAAPKWIHLAVGTASQVLTVGTSGLPSWEDASGGVSDHGALTGLGDDDHGAVYPNLGDTETISGDWTFSGGLEIGCDVGLGAAGRSFAFDSASNLMFMVTNSGGGRGDIVADGSYLVSRIKGDSNKYAGFIRVDDWAQMISDTDWLIQAGGSGTKDLVVYAAAIRPQNAKGTDLGTEDYPFDDLWADDAHIDSLTASKPLFTDGDKKLVSTGTMPVDQGGTGLTGYAAGDVLYASDGATLASLAVGDTGHVLTVGTAGLPEWREHSHWGEPVFIADASADEDDPDRYTTVGSAVAAANLVAGTSVRPVVLVVGDFTIGTAVVLSEYVTLAGYGRGHSRITRDSGTGAVVEVDSHCRVRGLSLANTVVAAVGDYAACAIAVRWPADLEEGKDFTDIKIWDCYLQGTADGFLMHTGSDAVPVTVDDFDMWDCEIRTNWDAVTFRKGDTSYAVTHGSIRLRDLTIRVTYDAGEGVHAGHYTGVRTTGKIADLVLDSLNIYVDSSGDSGLTRTAGISIEYGGVNCRATNCQAEVTCDEGEESTLYGAFIENCGAGYRHYWHGCMFTRPDSPYVAELHYNTVFATSLVEMGRNVATVDVDTGGGYVVDATATYQDASKLTLGTLPDARLSANVPAFDGAAGDLIARDADGDEWVAVNIGTATQVLTVGTTGLPQWTDSAEVGVTDHGALSGLSDHDHTQYARLASNDTVTGQWVFSAPIGILGATAQSGVGINASGTSWMRILDCDASPVNTYAGDEQVMMIELRPIVQPASALTAYRDFYGMFLCPEHDIQVSSEQGAHDAHSYNESVNASAAEDAELLDNVTLDDHYLIGIASSATNRLQDTSGGWTTMGMYGAHVALYDIGVFNKPQTLTVSNDQASQTSNWSLTVSDTKHANAPGGKLFVTVMHGDPFGEGEAYYVVCEKSISTGTGFALGKTLVVCYGSRADASGSVTLNAYGSSGVSGTVDLDYSVDDSDITLTAIAEGYCDITRAGCYVLLAANPTETQAITQQVNYGLKVDSRVDAGDTTYGIYLSQYAYDGASADPSTAKWGIYEETTGHPHYLRSALMLGTSTGWVHDIGDSDLGVLGDIECLGTVYPKDIYQDGRLWQLSEAYGTYSAGLQLEFHTNPTGDRSLALEVPGDADAMLKVHGTAAEVSQDVTQSGIPWFSGLYLFGASSWRYLSWFNASAGYYSLGIRPRPDGSLTSSRYLDIYLKTNGTTDLYVEASSKLNQDLTTDSTAAQFDTLSLSVLKMLERSSDPTQPSEGQAVIWMSDGTGKGDDGDVMVASTAGGTTNYATLFDHSAGAAW